MTQENDIKHSDKKAKAHLSWSPK